ncbi:MAG: MATE family efflux transporter [Lachnospiraceae bacterium]|nr:MATE family efflux transporter [Lachnospiraceae bacterium]
MVMRKLGIKKEDLLFSDRDLWMLLIPLMIEQILNALMGTVDTMMVSNVGSAAISAVSLVDSINNLMLQVFLALAAGGTIVCSQYLGKKEEDECNRAAQQVFLTMLVISVGITVLCVAFRYPLLRLVFGQVEADVMEASQTYFLVTALSYPFIALFNANAAFFRAEGNSRLPMIVSVICNFINIGGNAIMIFGFGMGVLGAALSTLIARIVMAVVMISLQRRPKQVIVIRNYAKIRPEMALIGVILSVGIPSGIENGMFQFGKLAIQSTVSTLGTTAIAAQAMTNTLEYLNSVAAIGVGIGLMTVVGQCIGAGKKDQAVYYIIKLIVIAEVTVIVTCLLTFAVTRPVTRIAGMEAASAEMCCFMMKWIAIIKPFVWAMAFIPAYGMRAAGDVKFSMVVSTVSMWVCRVALCVYLCRVQGFGPIAVWIGMFTDWTVRGIVFGIRFRSQKWLHHQVV